MLRNIKAKIVVRQILPPKGRSDVIKFLIYHIAKLPKRSELCNETRLSFPTAAAPGLLLD